MKESKFCSIAQQWSTPSIVGLGLVLVTGCNPMTSLNPNDKKDGASLAVSTGSDPHDGSGSDGGGGGGSSSSSPVEITSKIHLMDQAEIQAQMKDLFPHAVTTVATNEDIQNKFDVLGGPCDARASRLDGVVPPATSSYYDFNYGECLTGTIKITSRGPALPAPSVARMAYVQRTCNRVIQNEDALIASVNAITGGSYTTTTAPALTSALAAQAFSYFYLRDEMGPALAGQVLALAGQAAANETTANKKTLRSWEAVLYTFCTDPGLWVL